MISSVSYSRTDSGLNLSPSKHLQEILLTFSVDPTSQSHFPRFSAITSGTMSRITVILKAESPVKGFLGRFREAHYWSGVSEDLVQLAEFQGGSGGQRVEFVVDLSWKRFGSGGKRRKMFEKDWWIEQASRYTFAKFSQVGKIGFTLPSSVSGSTLSSLHQRCIYACADSPSPLFPPRIRDSGIDV